MITKDHFLEPEERCGEVISREKKMAWKSMLDMLEIFIQVCKKYGFTYYAMGGTMLGAARHKGMIPWDDDIDVMMPRKDYDAIQSVLQKELPDGMFMQSTLTDKEYMNPHFKIRDSRTSGIDMNYFNSGIYCNFGIFLDVFPIDGVPEGNDYKKQLKDYPWLKAYERNAYRRNFDSVRSVLRHFKYRLKFMLRGRKRFIKWRDNFFARYKLENCKEWVAAAANFTYECRYRWPKECFEGGTVELPFEYLTVTVPRDYEKMLTLTYGDWHKFVKGAALHSGLILDANVPYEEKLKELKLVKANYLTELIRPFVQMFKK